MALNACQTLFKQNNLIITSRSHVLGDNNSIITYILYYKVYIKGVLHKRVRTTDFFSF